MATARWLLGPLAKFGEAATAPVRWITSRGHRIPLSPPGGGHMTSSGPPAIATAEPQPARFIVKPDTAKPQATTPQPAPATMHPATDEERKAAKIPPAWTNVWMNNDPNAALQAVGVDSKGRKQYRYSSEHSEEHAAAKFARVRDFDAELPALRQKIERDLGKREEAAVLYLVNLTGFRIGSDSERQAATKAYGASTLLPEHVKLEGDTAKFSFVGKKGVRINKTVTDGKLAAILGPRVGKKGPLFEASDADVRGYLHSIDGQFTVKDFRTWQGTARALKAIQNMPVPKTEKDLKKARGKVGDLVAGHLGNTRAVALSSYIDPRVFERWEEAVSRAGQ